MTNDRFLLTPLQHAMACAWLRAPQAGIDVEQWIVTFHEAVDVAALRRAWRQTVATFGALRTEIDLSNPATPQQCILPQVTEHFELHDWREVVTEQIAAQWNAFLDDDRRRGLDLRQAPLWRMQLIRTAENEYRLLCTYHHVLLDGRSLILMGREFLTRYDAECRGNALPIRVEPQFQSFVESLRQSTPNASAEYWREALADRSPVTLPEPSRTTNGNSGDTTEVIAVLEPSEIEQLRNAAVATKTTLHNFAQAAWALTLAAFTGDDDHTFGSVRACRKLPVDEIDGMVGMLINTVPFRVRIDRRATVRSFLERLRRQQLTLRDHETTPPTDVARFAELRTHELLFPTLLMFTDRRPEAMLDVDGRPHPTRTVSLQERSGFPLALTVADDGDVSLCLEYAVGQYDAEIAEQMLTHFRHVLNVLPTALDATLDELPHVSPDEQRKLLAWGRSERNPAIFTTIPQRFAQRVAEAPEATAVIAGTRSLTYAELHAQSRRSAAALSARHVGRGDLVGVFCERSPELAALILGIWQRGAVYVPLDPKYPSQRLQSIIAECSPKLIVHDRPLPDGWDVDTTRTAELSAISSKATAVDCEDANCAATLDDRAVVLFTSGSTGTPKGVVLSHRNLANHNEHVVRTLRLDGTDRLAPVSSINFDASLEEFFCPLCAGATVVLPDADTLGSFARFLEFIERHRLTILDLPTSLWRELTNYLHESKSEYPASVRLIFMGGEQATRTVYERFIQVGGRRLRWINAYGPTETTIFSTAYEHDPQRDTESTDAPPIGRPIDNTQAYVLDRCGRLVPAGVRGELYLGGAGVAEGYLGRPDLTAQKFVERPSTDMPPGRYYRTGDVVRWRRDGMLEYVGRGDDQIKLRGFRIEPAEIEAAFLRHPAVRDAAVVPQTSAAGTTYLAAYLVLHEGAAWDECSWREYGHGKLPEYMVPQAYVQLDILPQTPNGKVDRRALPEPFVSEPCSKSTMITTAKPTPFEQRVLDVWRETLQLDQLDLHEDFFAAGGDSLRAMALAAKLEAVLQRPIAHTLLWRARTAAEMAAELAVDLPVDESSTLVLLRDGDRTQPLFFVHSLAGDVWIYGDLAQALHNGSAVYGIPLQETDEAMPEVDDVVACAAEYVRRIRLLQSHGPYRVAGYSSGGLIAYEMTRQLLAAGEAVEFLGLLDSGVPTRWEQRLTSSRAGRLLGVLHSVPGYLHELRSMPFADRWKRIGRFTLNAVRRLRPRSGPAAMGAELNDRDVLECFAEDISFFPAARLELIKRHYRALDRYDPPPLETTAFLFRSTRQPMFAVQTPTMGWEHLIHGPLNVAQFGGSHSTLMRSPYVARLAAAVDAALSNLATYHDSPPSAIEATRV